MATSQPILSIETGYFNPHLWITYRCFNNCPSCYLKAMSKEDKSSDMSISDLRNLLESMKDYRSKWNRIKFTLYGAEPQTLSPEYIRSMLTNIEEFYSNAVFDIYTSLQKMNDGWISLLKYMSEKSNGEELSAVSYDGLMRGEEYNKKLFRNVKELRMAGVRVCVMSVVNKTMLELGPQNYVDVLENLGCLAGFSLKQFIPIKGQRHLWNKYATNMSEFSDFSIAVHEEIIKRGHKEKSGMIYDVAHRNDIGTALGGEVVFIDGGMRFLYMGYNSDKEEYLQEFGRLSDKSSFEDIVNSDKRKSFLYKQRLVNNRADCLVCDYAGRCLSEVYKDEYDDSDECIGAKRFVEWVHSNYGVLNDTNM